MPVYTCFFPPLLTYRGFAVIICCMSGNLRHAPVLSERLSNVKDMLGYADSVWDVGCDHGYLASALLASGAAKHIYATDLSPVSVAKAERSFEAKGQMDSVSLAVADGLSGFAPKGDYKLALCGMGGELIAQILSSGSAVAEGASLIVMQPMRGEEELRRFLLEAGYTFVDERVVCDDGRFYQIIAARYGGRDEVPAWFPKGYYRFGWLMCDRYDEALFTLLTRFRGVYASQLEIAEASGTRPQKLVSELAAVDKLIGHLTELGGFSRQVNAD